MPEASCVEMPLPHDTIRMLPTEPELLNSQREEGQLARTLRRLMLAVLIFAMSGTFVDLLFLDHHGDLWQMIPLALLATAGLTLALHAIHGCPASVRAIQVAMLLFVAGGLTGVGLHYSASAEFHTETDATLNGASLVWNVLHSKVPPTLAPASLIQMGLLGLAFTYRHPRLLVRSKK